MSFRSLLLRVLFWSLALAAVFGAMGVLFASQDLIWRVAGTSIATAVAALLLLAASSKLDKPASRPASLLAISLVVLEYLLTLAATWEMGLLFGNGRDADSLWLTVLFIALVGIPAIAFLRMTTTAITSLAGRAGLALAMMEMGMLLLVAWENPFSTRDWIVEGLAGWLPPFALLVVICLIGHGVEPRRHWRWIGVIAAAAAYIGVAYGTIRQNHQGGEVVVYITCVAAAIAHANIVLLCPLRPAQMWLRWLTIAAGIATTFFAACATYLGQTGDGMILRLAGACGIVAGCGTLALAILARLNRRFVASPESVSGQSEITLVCPLCHKKQTLALGGAPCVGCRAQIFVRVDEPKCATCGYSLLMLQSAACPECGTPVPGSRSPAGSSAKKAILDRSTMRTRDQGDSTSMSPVVLTAPASARPADADRGKLPRRSGFTLVELLIVIGTPFIHAVSFSATLRLCVPPNTGT